MNANNMVVGEMAGTGYIIKGVVLGALLALIVALSGCTIRSNDERARRAEEKAGEIARKMEDKAEEMGRKADRLGERADELGERIRKDKNVEIKSIFGDVKVDAEKVDIRKTGLPVYANARLAPREGDDDNRADVNVSTPWFDLQVVALKYETTDSPEKVVAFYREAMKKYGTVRECRGEIEDHEGKNGEFRCKPEKNKTSLSVGDKNLRRIVAVEQKSGKTEFAVVYISAQGDEKNEV